MEQLKNRIAAAFKTLEELPDMEIKEALKIVMVKHGYEVYWGINRWIKKHCNQKGDKLP